MEVEFRKLSVIGCGYVGLVSAAGLAALGHSVKVYDINLTRIRKLSRGEIPFFEPGLEDLIEKSKQRLIFCETIFEVVADTEAVLIAVDTPPKQDGSCNLSSVFKVLDSLAQFSFEFQLIIIKSTVPAGSCRLFKQYLKNKYQINSRIIFNPEFLREGQAVSDFFQPCRIIIGSEDKASAEQTAGIYESLDSKLFFTDWESAELIKYASNSFLAMKISFINEISRLSEKVNAEIEDVARGMGLDPRIGHDFLRSGIGWGGSCFPKDTQAIISQAQQLGCEMPLIQATVEVNEFQIQRFCQMVKQNIGNETGAVLTAFGLAFKSGTDDLRDSQAVKIVSQLIKQGYTVRAVCVQEYETARVKLNQITGLEIFKFSDILKACRNSAAILLLTDWPEFILKNEFNNQSVDYASLRAIMASPAQIFDGRNCLDVEQIENQGFEYFCLGGKRCQE